MHVKIMIISYIDCWKCFNRHFNEPNRELELTNMHLWKNGSVSFSKLDRWRFSHIFQFLSLWIIDDHRKWRWFSDMQSIIFLCLNLGHLISIKTSPFSWFLHDLRTLMPFYIEWFDNNWKHVGLSADETSARKTSIFEQHKQSILIQ